MPAVFAVLVPGGHIKSKYLKGKIKINKIFGRKKKLITSVKKDAHPGNRTPVSTVGGYYDTTTPDALDIEDNKSKYLYYIFIFISYLQMFNDCTNTS